MTDELTLLMGDLPAEVETVPGFNDIYLRLRRSHMTTRTAGRGSAGAHDKKSAAAPLHKSLTEKQLRALWFDGKFERRGLRLQDGRRLSIESPGKWNSDEGPDFLDAELRIDDQPVRGDVELHIRSGDWLVHKHNQNPNYDRVALHLVLYADRTTRSVQNSCGAAIPQLELKDYLTEKVDFLADNLDAEGYPYRSAVMLGSCGKTLGLPAKMRPEKYDFVPQLLDWAGDGRILIKSSIFDKAESDEQTDSLLYRKILEGLGYSKNKSAMLELADRLPYTLLKKKIGKSTGELRVQKIQSLLFGVSGLLPESSTCTDPETGSFVALLQNEWNNLNRWLDPMDAKKWKCKGMRPQNFPARRIAGAAYLIASSFESGFFAPALDMIRNWQQSEKSTHLFRARLKKAHLLVSQPGWGYFGNRASFGSKTFANRTALIGADRAMTIWVNAYLPALVAWSRKNHNAALEQSLHDFWQNLPSLTENHLSKVMLLRFLGSRAHSFPVKTERQQQGLIQVFKDFCDTKPTACTGCPFPDLITSSISGYIPRRSGPI